jgi:hypothetical protein
VENTLVLLFRKVWSSSKAEGLCGFTSCGLTAKTDGNIKCYWRKSMKTGDLVRRRNNGDLALVTETEWISDKVTVRTLKGHTQYWYPVEFEVVKKVKKNT